MKKSAIVTMVFLLFAFIFAALAIQNGYDLFQKALAKERAEGNLEEAIALYQKVIDETKDESLAAKAQLRIGICYEKLGRREAEKAYQKVIDKYPGQTKTVEAAREKLRLLLKPQPIPSASEAGLRIRFVSTDKPLVDPQVSPDGRSMVYCDYQRRAIAVYDIATGKSSFLKCRIEEDDPDGLSFSYRWSPDGKFVVCGWWGMLDYVWTDLRILSLDGAEPRRLVRGESGEVYVYDWSADKSRILAARYTPSQTAASARCQIITVAVSDGSIAVIKDLGHEEPGQMVFSPDGRFIIYDVPSGPSKASDIFVLTADGREEVPLIEFPTNERVLGWAPDGRHVLFVSDRSGTWGAWLVPVQDGKVRGEAKLIKQDIGSIKPIGFARDGTFYFSTSRNVHNVYIQDVDLEKGMFLGAAELAVQRFVGSNHCVDWSPDGKHLAYVSIRSPSASSARSHVLCIQNIKSGQVRELVPELEWFRYMRWSPDGRSLIARGSDGVRGGEFVIDVATGAVNPLLIEDLAPIVEWANDSRSIYYVHHDVEEQKSEIVLQNLETRQKRTIAVSAWDKGFIQDFSLSHDGRCIATRIIRMNDKSTRLAAVSTEGGEIRVLMELREQGNPPLGALAWSPDSRKILYVMNIAQDKSDQGRLELWLFSIDSGENRKVGDFASYVNWLSLHPDGHLLAFHTFAPKRELWAMENFLSETEKK
jgi:Tol biopolymer transport system component